MIYGRDLAENQLTTSSISSRTSKYGFDCQTLMVLIPSWS